MSRFILMLTKDDRTVSDACEIYDQVRTSGVRAVGFKDVGLPFEDLERLCRRIRGDGREAMLEVVSTTVDSELRSVEAAVKLGVHYVLGGRNASEATRILKGRGMRYFPFAGRTVGHPTRLEGSIEEVVEDARRLCAIPGVHGLDLLAYRSQVDAAQLIRSVVAAVRKPVIAAGSIDGETRVEQVQQAGAWGFTVGSALFRGKTPTVPS